MKRSPKYYNIYRKVDSLTMHVNAAEYGFGWELGYQKRIQKMNRIRGGLIASVSM